MPQDACKLVNVLNCSCTANPRHHRHEADLHKSEFYQLENWPINIFNMRISHKLNRTGETPRSPGPHYRIAPVKWHVMIYLSPFPHILSLCATIFTFLSLSVCLRRSASPNLGPRVGLRVGLGHLQASTWAKVIERQLMSVAEAATPTATATATATEAAAVYVEMSRALEP